MIYPNYSEAPTSPKECRVNLSTVSMVETWAPTCLESIVRFSNNYPLIIHPPLSKQKSLHITVKFLCENYRNNRENRTKQGNLLFSSSLTSEEN